MSWQPTDLAYIAGFFDGEGCITSTLLKAGYSRLMVQIEQQSDVPLRFITERFGGKLVWNRKCWQVRWNGMNALPILEAMLPYLVLKREQARLAIEWLSLDSVPRVAGPIGRAGRRGMQLDPQVRARRFEIDSDLRRLKAVA